MYNFGIFLANEASGKHSKGRQDLVNKYQYSVDISTALRTARKYFLRKPTEKPIDILRLLAKFVHAVKEPFRKFARPLHGIGALRFNYK